MKIEHVIMIVLAIGGAVLTLFADQITSGPERMAMLEYQMKEVLERCCPE